MKIIPDSKIMLFKSCLVSVEYPGIESSSTFLFDQLGVDYHREDRQSCCTGLGHYYDLFDQFSTTALAARNFWIARESDHPNITVMCATCYTIMKKAAEILNHNLNAREQINGMLKDAGLDNMIYHKGDIDPQKNIFHVAEVLFNKKDTIEDLSKVDFSQFNIASHHACHYCKVHCQDTLGGVRDSMLIDELTGACGVNTVRWYDQKRMTCGAGFRQRFTNQETSLKVTAEKLLSLKETRADLLLHMCPNCQMQFDRYQRVIEKRLNEKFKLFHLNISQFLALALGADPYNVVGVQTHTIPLEPMLKRLDIIQSPTVGSKLEMNY